MTATEFFSPTEALGIPIRIKYNEPKAQMETHPIVAESKISNYLM